MNSKRKQVHVTKDQQLLLAIEQLALGREHIIKKQRLTVTELVEFHDSLRHGNGQASDGGPDWGLERKYSNYRKVFKSFGIPVVIDFQMKIIQGFESDGDVQRRLNALYLRAHAWNYSEDALDLFHRNTPLGADALGFLVTLRYSILHGLHTDFVYRKLFSMRDTQRRVIPLCILVNKGQLFLVAVEPESATPKQFLMSRIVGLQSDLISRFHDKGRYPAFRAFRPDAFLASGSANFMRPNGKYTFRMYGNTYDHFRHFFNVEHRVIDGKPKKCTVEIDTHDEELIYQVALRYGEWCQLNGPHEATERMIDRMQAVIDKHNGRPKRG